MKKSVFAIGALVAVMTVPPPLTAQDRFPDKSWKMYKDPAAAGFSSEGIEQVKLMFERMGGAALLVVHDGAVVLSLGDPTQKIMDHSMRKSYLSALFGIAVKEGSIDLDATLKDLGIDDLQSLTDEERTATIRDLLAARSGIYHPSAYSPRSMSSRLPARGSQKPGAMWFYNNWDFNALGTIYNQLTREDLFKDFERKIALPLGFEDYRAADCFYRTEDISRHPAYLFRLSPRDEARFGLLYLRSGWWKGREVVPSDWVRESTRPITSPLPGHGSREGYGYLWWISRDIDGKPAYYASGLSGQRIAVIPSRNLVIVQSTDTYDLKEISDQEVDSLIASIQRAQTLTPAKDAVLMELPSKVYSYPSHVIRSPEADSFPGTYRHRLLGNMTIERNGDNWVLATNVGQFTLHPRSESEFIPEDIRFPIEMVKADKPEAKGTVTPNTDSRRELISIRFNY